MTNVTRKTSKDLVQLYDNTKKFTKPTINKTSITHAKLKPVNNQPTLETPIRETEVRHNTSEINNNINVRREPEIETNISLPSQSTDKKTSITDAKLEPVNNQPTLVTPLGETEVLHSPSEINDNNNVKREPEIKTNIPVPSQFISQILSEVISRIPSLVSIPDTKSVSKGKSIAVLSEMYTNTELELNLKSVELPTIIVSNAKKIEKHEKVDSVEAESEEVEEYDLIKKDSTYSDDIKKNKRQSVKSVDSVMDYKIPSRIPDDEVVLTQFKRLSLALDLEKYAKLEALFDSLEEEEETEEIEEIKEVGKKSTLRLAYYARIQELNESRNVLTIRNNILQAHVALYYKRKYKRKFSLEIHMEGALKEYYEKLEEYSDFKMITSSQRELVDIQLDCIRKLIQLRTSEIQQKFDIFQKKIQEFAYGLLQSKTKRKISKNIINDYIIRQKQAMYKVWSLRVSKRKFEHLISTKKEEISDADKIGGIYSVISMEELKYENFTYTTRLEETEDEMVKYQDMTKSKSIRIAHIKESSAALQENLQDLQNEIDIKDTKMYDIRSKINAARKIKDRYRERFQVLESDAGLLLHPELVRDIKKSSNEVISLRKQLQEVQEEYMLQTRYLKNCQTYLKDLLEKIKLDVSKRKIYKVKAINNKYRLCERDNIKSKERLIPFVKKISSSKTFD